MNFFKLVLSIVLLSVFSLSSNAKSEEQAQSSVAISKCDTVFLDRGFGINPLDYFVYARAELKYFKYVANANFDAARFDDAVERQSSLSAAALCFLTHSIEDRKFRDAYKSGAFSKYISNLVILKSSLFALKLYSVKIEACDSSIGSCVKDYLKLAKNQKQSFNKLIVELNQNLDKTWLFITSENLD